MPCILHYFVIAPPPRQQIRYQNRLKDLSFVCKRYLRIAERDWLGKKGEAQIIIITSSIAQNMTTRDRLISRLHLNHK